MARSEPLSQTDIARLEFERARFRSTGAKEAAVYDQFGESATRYHQRLQRLLDDPRAMAYDAQLVNRLLRRRDSRRSARTERRIDA